MFSMTYLPGAERLTIVVIKARNLRFIGSDKKHLPGKFILLDASIVMLSV